MTARPIGVALFEGTTMASPRGHKLDRGIVGTLLVLAAAASPPAAPSPEALIRKANAAFVADHRDEAERLYAEAEEQIDDPGLVAFNRAAVLFQKGEFRDAELLYDRVLGDAACPPERAAKASYNRGTCVLRRGGSSSVFQAAITDFESCLDSATGDELLRAHARHNLELAKLLWKRAWDEETRAGKKPPPPGESQPRPEPRPEPKATEPKSEPGKEPGTNNPGGTPPKVGPQPKMTENPTTTPNGTENPNRGQSTTAPELKNEDAVQPLSPEDTRELLRRTAERLKKDRHALLETLYPKYKPGARDW